VAIEIVPEPSPAEREALLQALAGLGGDAEQPPAYRSAWRRAALDLVVDDERLEI
jgi:hypothetical protein